ncbi:nucleotidyltransferase domain-containing protein [Candidatus Omnitrophota bacterium]
MEKILDHILNTGSKLKIIRLFSSRNADFIASGRQIARLIELTPPAVHSALKQLYNHDILKREIVGKQHLYKLNTSNRIVKDMLLPTFKKEHSVKKDIFDFLKSKIQEQRLKNGIISLILYGSLAAGSSDEKSDVDIAVIAKGKIAKKQIEKIFSEDLANEFYDYFGVHLDIYIKTKEEFVARMKKHAPPVSTLMRSYLLIYGKDPLEFK